MVQGCSPDLTLSTIGVPGELRGRGVGVGWMEGGREEGSITTLPS